jgi:fibronectin-binding autotransporter adhesin
LTGAATFSVAANTTVTTSGPFTDNGSVQSFTMSGAGTLAVGVAAPTLSAGTGVIVSSGTLNMNSGTAFGPSPNVTANGGILSLGTGTNPTFASLNGASLGSVILNGNTLSIGSVSASYAGGIQNGSAAGVLVKTGAGTQTLSGFSTFSGGVTVNSGTLAATAAGALGTGPVTLNGGILSVGGGANTVSGFGGLGNGWTANGSASFPAFNVLQLSPLTGGTGSAWLNIPITASSPFTINFTLTSLVNAAGGITVGFENQGLNAFRAGANNFGYTGITPSAVLALNFDGVHTQGGVGSGIGVLTNGANPSTIEPMPSTAPVNFGGSMSGPPPPSPTNVTIAYDGTNAHVFLVQGTASYSSPPLPLNITGAVGSSAFLGFTGSTGGVFSQLQISNFSFTSPIQNIYANNVILTVPSATILVAASAAVATVNMGSLTMATNSTLNINPDPSTPTNLPYGITFTGTTLNGANTFAVPANGSSLGALGLGVLTNGPGTGSITVTGGPNVTVSGGSILGRLALGGSNLSLGGASLTVGSLAGTAGTLSGNATAPVTLTVGSDNTSTTYGGTILDGGNGSLALTKNGTGTLTLTGANTYSGGTVINNGTLAIAGDATLGTGPVTIGALGTLTYSVSTTSNKSFFNTGGTIAGGAGAVLTLNGSTFTGGYVGGAGTFSTSAANGARFFNVTSLSSATIVSNSPADQFVNFTNSAALTVAAGVNTTGASTTVNFNGFTNQGDGSITIGADSKINVANFVSYGTLMINPAVVGSGQETLLTNVGSSALSFGAGSRTFIGTPATANYNGNPSRVAGIDLHGHNLVIAGGLFVNNGFLTDSVGGGQVIVDYGALFKGAGYTGVPVNGSYFQFPGASSFASLVIGPGGIQNYSWQINDARGLAGPSGAAGTLGRGWGLLQASIVTNPFTQTMSTGNLTWTATSALGNQFDFALQTLLAPTPIGPDTLGSMDNFHARLTAPPGADDGNQSFVWPVITYQGTYSGPTDSATLTADTLFDTSLFANPHPGKFTIQLDQVNKAIDLVYTPVPEPGTLTLVGLAAAGGALLRRSRRR